MPTSVEYQWLRNGQVISSATDSTYELTQSDVDMTISVKLLAKRVGYISTEVISESTSLIQDSFRVVQTPSVSGVPQIGKTLLADEGEYFPAPNEYSYQWLRNGIPIMGANQREYVLSSEDFESTVSVTVIPILEGYYPDEHGSSNLLFVTGASSRLFNAGLLISDTQFFNGNAMSQTAVQNFLNEQVPNCEIGAGNPLRDPGIPFGNSYVATDCLPDFTQSTPDMAQQIGVCNSYQGAINETAASIIHKVGISCGISQKVLLSLIEKEQGLVTDTWPTERQYGFATGFACIDNGLPCPSDQSGFFYQVWSAAKQLKKYGSPPFTWYPVGQTVQINYSPNPSCGSSPVVIANRATAALYYYTPYTPNVAALSNLYGVGDNCSSYGIRNFWRLYFQWFGNPTG